MSTIQETYNSFLTSKAAKFAAQNGLIPHKGVIEDFITGYLLGELNTPQSNYMNLEFVEGEPLSASKFNQLFELLSNDIKVLYQTIDKQALRCAIISAKLRNQDEATRNRAKELSNQLGALLSVYHKGQGSSVIVEDFNSSKNIDLENTTTFCDFKNRSITNNIEQAPWPLVGNVKLDIPDTSNILKINAPSPNENLVLDGTDSWKAELTVADSSLPAAIDLTVNLGSTPVSLSALSLTLKDSSVPVVISLYSSLDGIQYFSVLESQTLINGLLFFETVEAKSVRLRITKSNADVVLADGRGKFIFDIKKLVLLWVNNAKREKFSYLQTLGLTPIGGGLFSSVSLDACESIPQNSNIIYKVSFGSQNSFGPWLEIKPSNRSGNTFENSVVTVPGTLENYRFSGLSAARSENVLCEIGVENYLLYQADSPFLLPDSLLQARDTLLLWRNIANSNTVRYRAGEPVPSGWVLEDGYYKTWLLLARPTSLFINNNQGILIDGAPLSGSFVLDTGPHFFQIKQSEWASNGNYRQVINQLIANGSATIQAGILAHLTTMSDYLYGTNNDEYNKFCVAPLGIGNGIFIKSSNQLANDELFIITGISTITSSLADSIKLRAEFISDGKSLPILSGINLTVSK